jgi:predicted phosphate transport protein (TIGR00153 family)
MSIISKLFGKSPFEPLYQHMCKVKKCVDLIQPLMRAFVDENFEEITKITKKIFKAEHEADLMKKEIRINLPKGIFLPVARGDVLRFLKEQDNIADATEDLAGLLAIRRMKVPTELKEELQNLVDEVLEAFDLTMKVSSEIKILAETSFGGAEAHKVMEMIEKAQKMFSLEDQLDPVSVMMWMHIFRELGNLANHAENTGDQLRIMLHE